MAPRISGSPERLTTLPQALFCCQKNGLYFEKPLTCGHVAAGAFFFRKMAPIFLEAPNLWVRCRRRFFFPIKKGPIFLEALLSRTARIHQIWARIMRARHGNIWHGTDPPDLGTARHGTSLFHRRLSVPTTEALSQSLVAENSKGNNCN